MAPLMKYEPGRALAAFTDLAFDLMSGATPRSVVWPRLTAFKLRDADGRYWAPGVCSRRWFRFDDSHWRHARAPAAALEAPLGLVYDLSVLAKHEPDTSSSAPDSGEPAIYTDGAASVEAIVTAVMADYEKGLYASTDAEMLLQDHYAPDMNGTMWSLGCRTRRWYAWRGDQWQAMPAPPAREILPSRGDQLQPVEKQIQFALLQIFASDTPIPEAVATPWQPPADLPEMPRFCTVCFAANPVDSAFCRLCGATSEKLVSDPEPEPRRTEPAPDAGRNCPNCSEPCNPAARFCQHCGANLEKAAAKRTCASCGQELAEGLRFCTRCGAKAG